MDLLRYPVKPKQPIKDPREVPSFTQIYNLDEEGTMRFFTFSPNSYILFGDNLIKINYLAKPAERGFRFWVEEKYFRINGPIIVPSSKLNLLDIEPYDGIPTRLKSERFNVSIGRRTLDKRIVRVTPESIYFIVYVFGPAIVVIRIKDLKDYRLFYILETPIEIVKPTSLAASGDYIYILAKEDRTSWLLIFREEEFLEKIPTDASKLCNSGEFVIVGNDVYYRDRLIFSCDSCKYLESEGRLVVRKGGKYFFLNTSGSLEEVSNNIKYKEICKDESKNSNRVILGNLELILGTSILDKGNFQGKLAIVTEDALIIAREFKKKTTIDLSKEVNIRKYIVDYDPILDLKIIEIDPDKEPSYLGFNAIIDGKNYAIIKPDGRYISGKIYRRFEYVSPFDYRG